MDEPDPIDLEPLYLQCRVREPTQVAAPFPGAGSRCDLWIQRGRIVIQPTKKASRNYLFRQIEYRWPTVVLQRIFMGIGSVGLLIDIDRELGVAWIDERRSVGADLDAYGFNVIRSPRRTLTPGRPLPVPRDVLGSHINEVPSSLVAQSRGYETSGGMHRFATHALLPRPGMAVPGEVRFSVSEALPQYVSPTRLRESNLLDANPEKCLTDPLENSLLIGRACAVPNSITQQILGLPLRVSQLSDCRVVSRRITHVIAARCMVNQVYHLSRRNGRELAR